MIITHEKMTKSQNVPTMNAAPSRLGRHLCRSRIGAWHLLTNRRQELEDCAVHGHGAAEVEGLGVWFGFGCNAGTFLGSKVLLERIYQLGGAQKTQGAG